MEKIQFVNLIDKLSVTATLDKWKEAIYERQLDTFIWKREKLSKNTVMVKVSHDTYLYLTPTRKIEGVFVEYLNNNFTKHNTEYKGMTKLFNKKISKNKYTISGKTKKVENYLDKFTETLKADIYKDAIQDKKTIDDLDFVISAAFAA